MGRLLGRLTGRLLERFLLRARLGTQRLRQLQGLYNNFALKLTNVHD